MPLTQQQQEADETRGLSQQLHREKLNDMLEGYSWCVGVLEKTQLPGAEIFDSLILNPVSKVWIAPTVVANQLIHNIIDITRISLSMDALTFSRLT